MKLKQTILPIFALAFMTVGALSVFTQTASAAGNCSKDAAYNDACMEKNRSGTPLSPTDFSNAVHSCEGRDSGGGFSGAPFDSQSGNCSNAVASCYKQVIDTSVCTNNTYLAAAADGYQGGDDGDLTGEQWDKTIDDVNTYTGGGDLATNNGTHDDRERDYDKEITDSKVCDARGSVSAADDCRKALNDAFDQCYDNLGGKHARVAQGDLDKCVNGKRQSIAANATECTAAGGTWIEQDSKGNARRPGTSTPPFCADPATRQLCTDKDTGKPYALLIGGQKCEPGDEPVTPSTTPPGNGSNNSPQQAGAYSCEIEDSAGKATGTKVGTNLIPCEGSGWGAIGNILKLVLMILTIMIGIVAVGGIAYGSILYASSGAAPGSDEKPGQVKKAKDIIRNIVFGLLLYGFMIAIINWLIPGGVIQ